MSLSSISPTSKKTEIKIQTLINSYIDRKDSIVFNAGAGAGKTYAVTESLKHIIKEHGERLMHHNQKVMCITYTNVATDKIKERLGNTDIVEVSTIHERLWALIKNYKKELVDIHVEKIREELIQLQFDLNENDEKEVAIQFQVFRDLSDFEKSEFKEVMIAHKNVFYKLYNKSAKDFRKGLAEHVEKYPNIIKNVSNFKKIVSTIYRIENYQHCLKQIGVGSRKFCEVRYEDKYNNDVLHRMIISHDTLLDYALKIIQAYDLLKRIILDRYPYILVDEYQDTNRKVVEIMQCIEKYAEKILRRLFVGYFGDTAQNIYDDGVGDALTSVHSGLKLVNKQFNRRSHSEIIDVINKIRNDAIKQESIYEDCVGGSVKFYTGTDDTKYQFIEKYRDKWDVTSENKLHCLVLMNKFVAELNGFPDVYNHFSNTNYYKIN